MERGQQEYDGGIFTIKARHCKRCGGILTNSNAIADGYGHVCKTKVVAENRARQPLPGQMTLDNFLDEFRESESK